MGNYVNQVHHTTSSSIVYHRLIYSTQSVGAMLWSMAQLRRGQLRMVVYVVGSCWWCGQLSVLARHTHMLHCPPVPTSSWKLCIDRPQFAVCLGSSSVFDSVLLPWRLLLGPICGGVLGWVRMLPTPASMLPQSTHPSIGPQGWHLASPEPPCCRVYGTWVCMGALRSLSCRAYYNTGESREVKIKINFAWFTFVYAGNMLFYVVNIFTSR